MSITIWPHFDEFPASSSFRSLLPEGSTEESTKELSVQAAPKRPELDFFNLRSVSSSSAISIFRG